MKWKTFLSLAVVMVMAAIFAFPTLAQANGASLADVRAATAAYHNTSIANSAGYHLVLGLDYCFDNPGVGGMGYHLINTGMLDTVIDPLKPEAMVYEPDSTGKYILGAVEYIAPIPQWDAIHAQAPMLFGQVFERDTALGVYTLHVWLWQANPSGIFNEWNPRFSCP
jgi:hypothetical protein